MGTRRAGTWFTWALAALVVLRFILITHDEIRAFPYDESAYIGQAGAWYGKNGYSDWTYSRQPGYPLFLAVGSLLGVPARLAIEGVWIGVALLLVLVAGMAGVGRGLRVVLFASLVFHPFATELFCRVLSENPYTCALLTMLAALGAAVTRRSRGDALRWGVLAGAAGAVAGITRQETILVYILIAFTGAIVVKMWWWNGLPRRLAVRRLLLACAVPMVMALAAEHTVRAANYARIGSYVMYDWSGAGFGSLYRAMLSIPPESSGPLRVPIPSDVRERAAAASPGYARLLDRMVNDPSPTLKGYWRAGELITGVSGEPGSYNLWLMRDAAWALQKFGSAGEADAFFAGVAREIRSAQGDGKLARRWAPMSFIPPEWGRLIVETARSVPTCWRMMMRIGFERGEPYAVGDVDRRRFDAVALRRGALLEAEPVYGVELRRARMVARFDAVKRGIAAGLPWMTVTALVVAVGGSIAAQFVRGRLAPAWFAVMALLWAGFVLRLLLVAMLDATGVAATNRYMFPSAAMLAPMGVLGLHAVVVWGRTRGKPGRGRPTG